MLVGEAGGGLASDEAVLVLPTRLPTAGQLENTPGLQDVQALVQLFVKPAKLLKHTRRYGPLRGSTSNL